MNLSTILSNIWSNENNAMDSDFDTNRKPDYFFVGDTVINEETGEIAVIENITPSPYPFDDTDYAYVVGDHAPTGTTFSDYWTYDQMSLWVESEVMETPYA